MKQVVVVLTIDDKSELDKMDEEVLISLIRSKFSDFKVSNIAVGVKHPEKGQ